MDEINVACTLADGEVLVNGLTLHRPALCIMDASPLYTGPTLRGEDLLIPGVPGRKAMPRRADTTVTQLRMLLDGRYNPTTGAPVANSSAGLRAIKLWMRANVTGPTGGDGTRTVTVNVPGGGSISGAAHLTYDVGERVGPMQRALLTVSVPLGVLV